MKYHSQLIEATLLKRPISFLVEVVLQSKRRIMLRCPNLGHLDGCDVLGTQLWFSAPSNGHCLPTLELVEVNGGFLVAINPEILKELCLESLNKGNITELLEYTSLEQFSNSQTYKVQMLNLEHKLKGKCYVCLEPIICLNDKLEGEWPINNYEIDSNLDYLILRKKQGHRAAIMFCILNSGIESLKVLDSKDSRYIKKMQYALQQGVEMLAYKANISTHKIELKIPLAIQLPAIEKL